MSNPSKRKGSTFEAGVVGFLTEHGFPHAERRVMGGIYDRGDVAGVPPWVLELKAERELNVGGALREAETEAGNAGTDCFAAILKRRQKPIADAYAVLPLWLFARLLKEANY